jgi:putative two-component system response regulator
MVFLSLQGYKRAWSTSEAIEYMRAQSGISFDPRLLELFLSLVPEVEFIRKEFTDLPMTHHYCPVKSRKKSIG